MPERSAPHINEVPQNLKMEMQLEITDQINDKKDASLRDRGLSPEQGRRRPITGEMRAAVADAAVRGAVEAAAPLW